MKVNQVFTAAMVLMVAAGGAWGAAEPEAKTPAAPGAATMPAAPATTSPAAAPTPAAPASGATEATPTPASPLGHVEVRGKGPVPMVLIPALGFDWKAFESFTERNAERYTMYAVTLPGFGGTPAPATAPNSTFADLGWLDNAEWAIVSMLDERGIKDAVFVGHGLGGQLALRMGIHHPARVRAIVNIQGHAAFQFKTPQPLIDRQARAEFIATNGVPLLDGQTDKQWSEQVQAYASGMTANELKAKELQGMFSRVERKAWTRYYLEYLAEDLTREVGAIKAPVMMVVGVEFAPQQLIEQQKQNWQGQLAALRGVEYIFYEETRDLVMIEKPAELDRDVARFVDGLKKN